MANIKQFTIQINGVQESINAVESLNTQLNALESRINALASKQVNISAKSSNSTGALNEEEKLVKQIQQTEEKIKATRTESYQQLLAEKDLLKEAVNDQKERAAQERLVAGSYSNTMKGLKEELADIKSVMQTTDLGDDKFKDLVGRAGQLTDKLKELEAQYGQFGRNVGNYASAAEGFKDLIANSENARMTLKKLKNEMQTLSVKKDMGIISEEEAERLKSLIPTVKQLESSIQDAGKPMDNLMDTMQSFVGLAQAEKGLSAFFGLEGTGVDETIKNLVALQNAMKGLQTIQQQLQSGEGLGKYFTKANSAIDSFTKKLFGIKSASKEVEKAEKQQAGATSAVANSSKAATTATQAQTTATAGLTIGMRVATVAAKALSMALKAIGIGILLEVISLAVEGIKSIVGAIGDWAKGDADLITSTDVLTAAIDRQNDKLSRNLDLIEARKNAGLLTEAEAWAEKEKAYAENMKEVNDELIKRYQLLNDEKLWPSEHYGGFLQNVIGDKGVTTFGGFSEGIKDLDEFIERWEHLEQSVANGEDIFDGFLDTASDARDEFVHLNKLVGEDFVNAFTAFADGTAEGTHSLVLYIDEMDRLTNGAYSKALKLVKVDNEDLQKQLDEALKQVETFKKDVENQSIIVSLQFDAKIQSQLDSLFPLEAAQRQIDEWKMVLINGVNDAGNALTMEERANIQRIITQSEKNLEERKRNAKKGGRSMSNTVQDIEKTMNSLRLKLMKDGLNKSLIQLEEEKRQTLTKLKSNQEAYLEAEKIFEQRRKDLIISAREKLADELAKLEEKNYKERIDVERQQIQNEIDNYTYWLSTFGEEPAAEVTPRFNIISSTTTAVKESLDDMYLEAVKVTNKTMMVENDYVSNLDDNLKERITLFNAYTAYIDKFQKERIKRKYELLRKDLDLEQKAEEESERQTFETKNEQYDKLIDRYVEHINTLNKLRDAEGKFRNESDEKEYNEAQKQLEKALAEQTSACTLYETTLTNIRREYQIKREKLKHDEFEENSAANEKEYNYFIAQYRNFLSDLNAANSNQPIMNEWGIVNYKKSKANYQKIKDAALKTLNTIQEKIQDIDAAVAQELMDEDTAKALKSQLGDIANSASEAAMQVQSKMSELGTELWKGINEWIQQVGQAANSIMSSISEITSNQYEEQISQQEKYIEEYSNLLDKQKDKTQEYADAVKDIEGELADARGDRRQQLIDALNAEMAAQRASLAEEKRIEKEKEKAERRKSELEYEQAIAEKNMSVAQAALNAVMAVSMAAVNKWPIPAIPMMALAAAVGAAQVAAAKSQYIPKPSYGDGGVIVGRSHAEGGVPVLGGQASVEGGEFITNKVTTAKNVDLLEYINSKRKKVDISDLLEFYNSGRPAKNISSIRTKFADGGVIPSLRSDIELSDRMYQAMEDYANRPTYVQVVDIIDRTERLNEVKVISGLEV